MKTWEEIQALVGEVKTNAETSAKAKNVAKQDQDYAADAAVVAALSAKQSRDAHDALVASANAVSKALAEIVAFDLLIVAAVQSARTAA